MNPTAVIDAAHDIATDIKGVCEDIYSMTDPKDLKLAADHMLALALRLDNHVLEHVITPEVASANQ
jgi:hypothetical protein